MKTIFENKTIPSHPKLKILFGLPGSGKGTITSKYRLLNRNTITFNYDELIMKDKNYIKRRESAKTKQESQKLYWEFRQKYASLDEKVNARALKNGYSVLWETTGANVDWMFSELEKFHKRDYEIAIHMPIVDFEDLINRILLREKLIGQEGAPIEQLRLQKDKISKNLIKLIPYVDKIYLYDNTGKRLQRSVIIRSVNKVECLKNFTKGFMKVLSKQFGIELSSKLKSEKSCQR